MYARVKLEVTKRVRMLLNTELNDINLVRATNAKVTPVAAYPMNVCKFSKGELEELDQVIKRKSDRVTYWESKEVMKGYI